MSEIGPGIEKGGKGGWRSKEEGQQLPTSETGEFFFHKPKGKGLRRAGGGAGKTSLRDEILLKINEMKRSSRDFNYDVTRVAPRELDHAAFSPEFVKQLGLPTVLYEIPQQFGQKTVRGYDTATLLTKMFNNGDLLPMLSYQNIMYTLGTEISDTEVYRAFEGMHILKNAIIPLVLGRFRTGEGSFMSMVGKDGQGGLLNKGEGNLDLREIIPAFRTDTLAKRALGILLAADGVAEHGSETKTGNELQGYEVGEINAADQALADRLKPEFRKFMREGVVKDGRPALKKEPGYSQRECVEYMDNKVASEIAKHLGCDVGRVDLMVMLYTALCGGPRMIEYREIYQRFPVLREADPCRIQDVTGLIKGDVIVAPLLRKLKVADDEKVREYDPKTGQMKVVQEIDPKTGKKKDKTTAGLGFGYIERQLKERGVDGLFDALLLMKDGHDVWKYWPAMVFDAMKKVEDIQKGEDSFLNEAERRKRIAEIMDPFAAGDPPQITTKTLEAIKKMPAHAGRGKLAEAGRAGFFRAGGEQLLGDIRDINESNVNFWGPLLPWNWKSVKKRKGTK